MFRASLLIGVLCASWPGMTHGGAGRVVAYKAPEGESLSQDFRVSANGQSLDVHRARLNDPPWDLATKGFDFGGAYSFVQFDFEGDVTLQIQSGDRSLEKVVVRPASRGIQPRVISAKVIEFTIDRPCQLSVEPEGRTRPLLVFANRIEVGRPSDSQSGVKYFGPGVHRPEGGVVRMGSGETLYLDGGAVLEGSIQAADAENIAIRGRGIISGDTWKWREGPGRMIQLDRCRNVSIEGVILRGAWAWTIVPTGCEDVSISNVKLCNGRVLNDDGINPVNSRRVTIRECFIRSMDDCIALKGIDRSWGDVRDIVVEDSFLWCDFARVTLLGHESRAPKMENITYRNLDIVHRGEWPVFLLEPGEDMQMKNLRFEDIRVEGSGQAYLAVVRPYLTQYNRERTWGRIEDVVFKDVRVEGVPGKYAVLLDGAGEHADRRIKRVSFENVSVLGEMLESSSLRVVIGPWLKPTQDGIRFSP